MKTTIYIYAISCILFPSHHALGGDMNAADFSLTIDASRVASVRRGLPLDLKVAYTGSKPIEVLSIGSNFLDISFDVPQGWTLRKQSTYRHMVGPLPIRTLRKDSSISGTIDLQDFFSRINPGKVTLGVTLSIWPDAGRSKQPVILRATAPLELAEETDESLQRYVNTISRQIVDEHRVAKRKELYRNIMGVSSYDVIAVLTGGLKDLEVHELHGGMRRKAYDLAEMFDNKQILVRYLVEDGARYDEYFFNMWQKNGQSLSEQELKMLCDARNPWIKLYTLKMCPKGRLVAGELQSLAAELEDMTSYLEALKILEK